MKAILIAVFLLGQVPLLWAQDFDAIKFCEEKKLQVNLCDRLEWGGVSASADNIKNCRSRASANTGDSKCSAAVAAEVEARRIKEGKIVRQKFSTSDLTDAGFGLPIIAERLFFYPNGVTKESEILTKPEHLCRYLGFSKAEEAIVDNTLHNGDRMRNKGMVVRDLNKWFEPGQKISIDNYNYDVKEEDFNMVKTYKEITCVKVGSEADKTLIKDVEAQLTYVGQEIDSARLEAERARKEVVDSERNKGKETPEVRFQENDHYLDSLIQNREK